MSENGAEDDLSASSASATPAVSEITSSSNLNASSVFAPSEIGASNGIPAISDVTSESTIDSTTPMVRRLEETGSSSTYNDSTRGVTFDDGVTSGNDDTTRGNTYSSDEISTDGENIMAEEEEIEGDKYICMTREQYNVIIDNSTKLESKMQELHQEHSKHMEHDHHDVLHKHHHHEHTKHWGALRKGTMEFIDEIENNILTWGIIKKPYLRQYWRGSVLVREKFERKASYTELFYDLVFVAAVRQMGHHLSEHLTGESVGMFVILFASIWKIWVDTTTYVNQFSTDDLLHKLYFLLMMMGITGLTINSSDPGEHSKEGYVLFFLYCRGIQCLIYLWVFCWIKEIRPMLLGRIFVVFVGSAFWVASLFVHFPMPPILWAIGIAVEFFVHFPVQMITKGKLPINIEHFTERCALFITLVLGEVVVGVVFKPYAIPKEVDTTHVYVQAFMGLVIALDLQWIYFDVEASPRGILQHAIRRDKRTGFIWLIAHQPLAASIIVLSSGLVRVIDHAAEGIEVHDRGTKWLLCGSVSLALFAISVIGGTHKNKPDWCVRIPKIMRVLVRLMFAIIMLFLPLSDLSVYKTLGIITAFTCIIVGIELYGSYQLKAAEKHRHKHKQKRVKKSIKELRELSQATNLRQSKGIELSVTQ